MHGIIVNGLKDSVVANHDWPTWRTIQDRADVERRLYTPTAQYPDRHGRELAAATRSVTGADEEELAYDVGRHLVPTLLREFGVHVTGVDSGVDVLADAESVVTRVLRRTRVTDVTPPAVSGERLDDETVLVRYGGDHCAGLRGVVAGLGEQCDEAYTVSERACTREGDDHCELVVHRSSAPAGDGLAASDD